MDKKLVKKLLSRSVHTNLTTLLQLCYEPEATKKQQDPHDKLRAYLLRLFSYYDLMELHNDHLEEFAEILQSLYAEQEDLVTYCYSIMQYLEYQTHKQDIERTKWITLASASNMKKLKPIEALDIQYQTMLHTNGYYAQRTRMQTLLYDCLHTIMNITEKECSLNAKKNTRKDNNQPHDKKPVTA